MPHSCTTQIMTWTDSGMLVVLANCKQRAVQVSISKTCMHSSKNVRNATIKKFSGSYSAANCLNLIQLDTSMTQYVCSWASLWQADRPESVE